MNKLGTHNTSTFIEGSITRVIYHETNIVEFDDNWIILNTGGWDTKTTVTRMNQASIQYDLGYRVYKKKGILYVDHKDNTCTFSKVQIYLDRKQIPSLLPESMVKLQNKPLMTVRKVLFQISKGEN